MRQNGPIRIIKHDQRARTAQATPDAGAQPQQTSERELRAVVSGWIQEHRQRAEEFRRSVAATIREGGFVPPQAASRA